MTQNVKMSCELCQTTNFARTHTAHTHYQKINQLIRSGLLDWKIHNGSLAATSPDHLAVLA